MKKLYVFLIGLFLVGCTKTATNNGAVMNAEKDLDTKQNMEESVNADTRDSGAEIEGETGQDENQMQAENGNTQTYTLAEVAEHDNADDCWIAIEGKVYDLTEYIDGGKHPGGVALLMGCGKDGTDLYNDRPNGSGAHSDTARSYLPSFYLGDLAE